MEFAMEVLRWFMAAPIAGQVLLVLLIVGLAVNEWLGNTDKVKSNSFLQLIMGKK